MHCFQKTLIALCLTTSAAFAQNQIVRGKVEDVRQTRNQFYLDCTTIPVVSKVYNLNLLVGTQAILEVVNIGTASKPVLDIKKATATTKIFDMGNLRFNKATRWQVSGAPGSAALIFINGTQQTSYLPLGGLGTWLLGLNAAPFASGIINNLGLFEFRFTLPSMPQLLGKSFTAQAAVAKAGKVTLTNPDCKTVQNK